mmetsp:Transcript_85415/g.265755  ORF Transcript_85415/g.265755 Transcript_85415/m.265755 type:complete len:162 (-) Transcript_85415:236-721(-)
MPRLHRQKCHLLYTGPTGAQDCCILQWAAGLLMAAPVTLWLLLACCRTLSFLLEATHQEGATMHTGCQLRRCWRTENEGQSRVHCRTAFGSVAQRRTAGNAGHAQRIPGASGRFVWMRTSGSPGFVKSGMRNGWRQPQARRLDEDHRCSEAAKCIACRWEA